MADRIRFHLDENVDPAIADGLRRRGVDVTVTNDVGLTGASDEEHLVFALAQQRVIVTHDEDFLAASKSGHVHCGIAYCHVETRSVGQIIGSLLLIADCLGPDEMQNHVEFL
jgi:predicted nuclease of predicted toxin-antitoxin system